jgi:hypothetical protein
LRPRGRIIAQDDGPDPLLAYQGVKACEAIGLAASHVEYWHGPSDTGEWRVGRPSEVERRVQGLVHEGASLWIDPVEGDGPVRADYRPHGVENVYVTGAGLWPKCGSWNPTLTMAALAQDLADQLVAKKG